MDKRKQERILEVLSFNFAEPKRYEYLWEHVQTKRVGATSHIGSKQTFHKYLNELVEEGIIERKVNGRKHVEYALANREHFVELKEKYESFMLKHGEKNEDDARRTIEKIGSGSISEEQIETVVTRAWLFSVKSSIEALCLLVDAGQMVSYVSEALLIDWVLSPFMLSAKVIEECYNKYPSETKRALKKCRDMFGKKPLG